ncbi:MAG: thiamine phosphate synthase [Hyphomicrobiales bacterium]|nr:thiamine phosphate synthase [Hyphomicrobiales bacterium]
MAQKTTDIFRPRLYLIAPHFKGGEALDTLREALSAGDVASVLFPKLSASLNDAAAIAQEAGAAALIAQTDSLGPSPFDGLHMEGDANAIVTFRNHYPDHIIGYGGAATRHEAMVAGEAGADYVAFGRLQKIAAPLPLPQRLELVSWWSNIFEVPCIAFAENLEAAEAIAAAGADFIAVGDWIWNHEGGATEAVKALNKMLERHGQDEVTA